MCNHGYSHCELYVGDDGVQSGEKSLRQPIVVGVIAKRQKLSAVSYRSVSHIQMGVDTMRHRCYKHCNSGERRGDSSENLYVWTCHFEKKSRMPDLNMRR